MLDRLEDRLLLSADGSFPPAVDTNQDGLFQPYDALILLNAVNHHTSVDDAPQLDLNSDGQLSTADVDLIIGSLNSYYGGDWDAESIAALDDVTLAISDTVVTEGAAAEVTVVSPIAVAHDPMAAESGGDTGTFRIERSYVTSEPVTVNFIMSDAEGHAVWGSGADDDYVLQNATYSLEWTTWFGWTWVGSATILPNEPFVDVLLVPNADSIDEPIEPAQLTIIAHGSEMQYGIDRAKATATVNIVGEHACRSAVETPSHGQTCLIVDQVDVFISFTVSDALDGTYSSKYRVPNDVFELLETENLANEESDDLWEKIKECGEENWDEVTGIPIPLQRLAQLAIPSANIAQTEIRRLDVEFSAIAKGTRYRYSGTASDGEWELDDSSGSSSFESTEEKIITKTKTFDYNVSVLDLRKHRQGGMWELVTRLHLMFRQLHAEMLADPPDLKDKMGTAIENQAHVDVVHWLGEEEDSE